MKTDIFFQVFSWVVITLIVFIALLMLDGFLELRRDERRRKIGRK